MKNIIFYLFLTFTLTYFSHGLLAFLTSNSYLAFNSFIGQILFIIGGSSPTIFAFFFILRKTSNNTKKELLARLLSYKHKPIIWIFTIVTPILLGGFLQLSYLIFKDHSIVSSVPFYVFFLVLIVSILFGGLEEVGWRGFLQERLMKSTNLMLLSLIIGIIWGFWHIPLFFIEEVSHYNFEFLPFLLGAIMFSTYLTWLYAVTKSILLTVIFHASINASATIGLSLIFEHSFLSYLVLILLTLVGFGLIHFTDAHYIKKSTP